MVFKEYTCTMTTLDQLKIFLDDYEKYIEKILKPEYARINRLLKRWEKPEYWSEYAESSDHPYPSPIQSISARIKRPEAVLDKILQKSNVFPEGITSDSFLNMSDCIGVRIIVYFLSQLPMLDREIRKSQHFEVSTESPPEAYLNDDLLKRFGLGHIRKKEKESGYYSVHYTVRLRESFSRTENPPWFEIQVRTMAQELWSEMEHHLAYKSDKSSNFSAKQRFGILSREISAIDEHFNLLYEELVHSHGAIKYRKGDSLNAENLPQALSEIGIRCAQEDIYTILTLLRSRGVETIGDLLNMATPGRMNTIRNTYMATLGRQPENFEIMASLGALSMAKDKENEANHVMSHIQFGKKWEKIKKKI